MGDRLIRWLEDLAPTLHVRKSTQLRSGRQPWHSELVITKYEHDVQRSRFKIPLDKCGLAMINYNLYLGKKKFPKTVLKHFENLDLGKIAGCRVYGLSNEQGECAIAAGKPVLSVSRSVGGFWQFKALFQRFQQN